MRIGLLLSCGLLLLSACAKTQSLKPRAQGAEPSKALDLEAQRAYLRQVREEGEKDIEEVRNAPYDPLDFEIPAQTERFDKRRAEVQAFLEKLSPEEVASLRGELDTLIFTLRTQGLELHGYALANQLRGYESCLRDLKRTSEMRLGADPKDPIGSLLDREDPEKRKARLGDLVFQQVGDCIKLSVRVQDYVKAKKLERLLYVAPDVQSFPQTAYDLGGARDVAGRTLTEKANQEPSLMVLHTVKVRLELLDDSVFQMGRLSFLSGEDKTALLGLVTSMRDRATKVRESLRLTPPIDKIETLKDVFQ